MTFHSNKLALPKTRRVEALLDVSLAGIRFELMSTAYEAVKETAPLTRIMEARVRLELTRFRLTAGCSDQLS